MQKTIDWLWLLKYSAAHSSDAAQAESIRVFFSKTGVKKTSLIDRDFKESPTQGSC